MFWSEYFANELSLDVLAADTSYASFLPRNENEKISLHSDILEAIRKIPPQQRNAIFICDVIHHLEPAFWQEILAKISGLFDIIIIKDIDSNRKFGNFCSAAHDRIINGTNFENVYPSEIEKFLEQNNFCVKITAMPKLWYPHFLLIATKEGK
ncbi:MAG: hypothetical protein LBI27_07760 [Clostridiales bacterium]|nr:hypothetical protein [Clostridiales bacterium]